ncbi:MAG: hypothetical protein JW932_17890 [Deltaproteobacteria bacterium]|nr:hypothetical protein [Deltaproteobacteria bacterium]
MGIFHLYASPIFKAKKQSLHGYYDVVDPNRLNLDLGTEENFHFLIR